MMAPYEGGRQRCTMQYHDSSEEQYRAVPQGAFEETRALWDTLHSWLYSFLVKKGDPDGQCSTMGPQGTGAAS